MANMPASMGGTYDAAAAAEVVRVSRGWNADLWRTWSLEVEQISAGVWVPGEDIGTLTLIDIASGDTLGWAHLSYDGRAIITPYGTKSGNDAQTAMSTDDIPRAAVRWVTGPGTVKQTSALAAQAKRAETVMNRALVADRARSLMTHLQERGITAVVLGEANETRAEVHCTSEDRAGSLRVAVYRDGRPYLQDVSGTARGVEILAAAIDDWETCQL